MNANASTNGFSEGQGLAEPFYFDSGENQLFAWLHRPAALLPTALGVVICSPFGYESICAHRSVREFADAIAAGGMPALRFDYLGTGDSAEINEDADYIKQWAQDVIAAIEELRHRTRVERICLLGIRLGTLLAVLGAAECKTVESLILIGPVVSGRRYVRDLRMTELAGSAMAGAETPHTNSNNDQPSTKLLEAGGFSLSAATLRSLGLVDLQKVAIPGVRSILILDNDKLPTAQRWSQSLSESGIKTEYQSLPGLIEMAMTAPQFAVVPRAMIVAAQRWLAPQAVAPGTPLNADRSVVDARVRDFAIPKTLPLRIQELPESPIIERPVLIAATAALFGIVTEPQSDEKRRRAVILLNPGADFHIGAGRMYVSLARRWARRGYFVLRLDLGGIGDSVTRPGNADDDVFPDEAVDDVRSAIDFMRMHYGIVELTLAGLCSGAYHALRAAAQGVSVSRILLVNPQNYFWRKGMTLHQVQLAEVVHNPGLYRQRMFSLRAWRRMFTGQVNLVRIAAIYFQRLRLGGEAVLRECAHRLHMRLPSDLGWELQNIVANGISVTFLFAKGEPGIPLLKLQAGSMLSRLGDRCRVRIVDSGDHIFSRRVPRLIMENVLSEELFEHATDPRTPKHPPSPLRGVPVE